MWDKATVSRPGLESLDELEDDEYIECLDKVDKHLRVNSALEAEH